MDGESDIDWELLNDHDSEKDDDEEEDSDEIPTIKTVEEELQFLKIVTEFKFGGFGFLYA